MSSLNLKLPAVVFSLFFLILMLLVGLGDALFPLVFSFAMAYLLFPLVIKLEGRGVNRLISVSIVISVIGLVSLSLAIYLLPKIFVEAKTFLEELPGNSLLALSKLEGFLLQYGVKADLSQGQIESFLKENSANISSNVLQRASVFVQSFFSDAMGWLLGLLNLFLIPLFFFYIISDFEKIRNEIITFIPPQWLPKLKHYAFLSNEVLSGYLRGQLMVALILSFLYGIGLSLVGLKFGFLIGLITGLISIIPYAGFSLGFATALMMAFANYSGLPTVIGVIAVFLIIQGLEGTFITPRLVGNKVGLSALMTMLALIIGGNLAGLFGMLIAIPFAAILKNLLKELKAEYQRAIKA